MNTITRDRRWLLALALAAAVAGCNQPTSASAGSATTPPPADSGAAASESTPAPVTRDAAEAGFELTMDKVDAYFATVAAIARMAQDDPSLASDENDDRISMDASESVDAYIARIEADPVAKRLVTSGGMSVHDFAYTNSAMIEGMMVAGMMEATGKQDIPDGVDPDYVRFAQEHKDELAAKAAGLQADLGEED
jgi:hypothetical protein